MKVKFRKFIKIKIKIIIVLVYIQNPNVANTIGYVFIQ